MEFSPSMPVLAKMDVSAANTADSSANTNHISFRLRAINIKLFFNAIISLFTLRFNSNFL